MDTSQSERGSKFYDEGYFSGRTEKRGSFSHLELGEKYNARTEFLLDRLSEEEKKRNLLVADLGAGASPFVRTLEALKKTNIRVFSFDFSSAAILQLRKRPEFYEASIYETPVAAETFDGVVAWDVLEHLDKPEKAIGEFARIIKPGGFVQVIVPNPSAYTKGTEKYTYRRDKSHVWPPKIGVGFFEKEFKRQGFEVEIFTRGFETSKEHAKKNKGKDLILPADENPGGTHIIVFARKKSR